MHYRFGEYQVDPAKRAFFQHGELVELPKKSFDVLLVLLQHRDRVVSKQELMQQVWPHQQVTENTLSQALTKLRAALHDDPKHPEIIRTVYGLGVQWMLPVEEISTDAAGLAHSESLLRWPFWLGLVTLICLAGYAFYEWSGRSQTSLEITQMSNSQGRSEPVKLSPVSEQVVGILPLQLDESLEVETELSSGLDTFFQRALNQIKGVHALSPRLAGSGLVQLQQQHGADYAVGLALFDDGGEPGLEVTLQESGQQIQQQFRGEPLTQLVQQGVEWTGKEIGLPLDLNTREGFFAQADPFVLEGFLRGLSAYNRGDYVKAAGLFELNVNEAPEYLVPRYELALVHRRLGQYDKSLVQLEVLAERDLTAEVRIMVNNARLLVHWRKGELEQARQLAEEAVALLDQAPVSLANRLLQNYALVKRNLGDLNGARTDLEQVVANCRVMQDNYSLPLALNNLSGVYIQAGELDLAEAASEEAVGLLRASNSLANLARALSRLSSIKANQGDLANAKAYLQQALTLNTERNDEYGVMSNETRLAQLHSGQGLYSDAETLLLSAHQRALKLNAIGGRVAADNQLAEIALKRGNLAQAESYYQRLLEAATTSGDTRYRVRAMAGLADVACADNRYNAAKTQYLQALDLAESRTQTAIALQVLRAQVECEMQQQTWDVAGVILQRLLAGSAELNNPNFKQAVNLTAARYYLHSDLNQARTHLQQAAEFSDTSFDYLTVLAEVRAVSADTTGAYTALQQAKQVAGERWTDELEQRLLDIRQPGKVGSY